MNEDNLELLQALGSLAREQQFEHERLEALCDDQTRKSALERPAPAAHEARPRTSEINTRTRAATSDTRLMQATTPLSSDQQDQIAERVRHALAIEHWQAAPARGEDKDLDEQLEPRSPSDSWHDTDIERGEQRARLQLVSDATNISGAIHPQRRRGFNVFQWTGLLLPLTAAAAAALLFRTTTQPIAALPEYSMRAQGNVEYRAEPSVNAPLRVAQGSALRLELRPSIELTGPVDIRVLLQHADGSAEWPAKIETSPSGSMRVTLQRADIRVEGKAKLQIIVARPEAMTNLGHEIQTTERGEGWQAWQVPIELP